MSFQAPPQTNVGPPGSQGNMMPGYLPPTGLPPPPIPPSFPGYQVPPPGHMQGGHPPGFSNSGQGHRPHFVKKQNDYYDKRNYQQNYRPPNSDKPTVTVFVGNITEHASDALIRQLLMKCGIVINWKRVQGADGKLQAFGFCEYVDPETGLRAIRLLHDLSFGERNLVVKVDQKTKEMLEEYKKKMALKNNGSENNQLKDGEEEELDEATKSQDEDVKKAITALLSENADVLSGKFKASGSVSKWKQTHSGSEENLEGMGMDKDKRHLISKEIRSFRDTYKDSQKQQRDKDKEDEGSRDRERPRERSLEKERERSRSQEKPRDRSDDRSRSQSKEREKDRDRDSRDRDRDNRERDRDRRDRDRDRRDREGDRRDREGDRRDREGDRRDREGDRRDRDNRENKGSSRSNRDRELDEDDSYERRKRERRQKERSQAFVERLKAWETRERKKLREYDRELEKEREIESEQSREKKHLLEFLEDYDDEQDDPKYYRGNSFDRRLQARIQEMESDDKDRQREMEEIEEIRKRLGDRAVEPEEEPMEEEPEEQPEPEPEPRPTLQATFKPAVPVVESAPNVASPVQQYHSPQNVPAVNQNFQAKVSEPQTEVDGEVTQKKTLVFEMKSKGPVAVASASSNRKKLEAVFNSEEDSFNAQAPKRKLIPLDYSEEEKKAVATAKSAEQKKKSIKTLIERIPTAKNELFAYPLDWECVDQLSSLAMVHFIRACRKFSENLIDRRIRPWVNKKIVEYIGEEEPSLVDFMCTKLLARSAPDNILHDVSMVLDDEAEVFVVKMWRLLIYETEAKKIGLVK